MCLICGKHMEIVEYLLLLVHTCNSSIHACSAVNISIVTLLDSSPSLHCYPSQLCFKLVKSSAHAMGHYIVSGSISTAALIKVS